MSDVWSCKELAWDVVDLEEEQIAADLASCTCLRERPSKSACLRSGRIQPPPRPCL